MKVKFLETAIYEGERYEVGNEVNVSADVAKVLGGSVRVLEKEKPNADKNVNTEGKKSQAKEVQARENQQMTASAD